MSCFREAQLGSNTRTRGVVASDASVEGIGSFGMAVLSWVSVFPQGSPGVLHGSFSYLLQDQEGQVIDPHSISAG